VNSKVVSTSPHERSELRIAARNHTCWSWREKSRAPGEGWDGNQPCTRIIGKGEQYLRNTIYPGHDSGYADNFAKRINGEWVEFPGRPISSKFCLPCAGRWVNLKKALSELMAGATS
jgi:hypothetical protein